MSHGRDSDGERGSLTHPPRDLDELLTHAVRFSIVAALAGVQRVEIAAAHDSVEISDAMLSKQVAAGDGGLRPRRKGRVGRRPLPASSRVSHSARIRVCTRR